MGYMFRRCESLISLPDISNWNIPKVIDIHAVFSGCKNSLNIPEKFKNN